MKNYLCSNCKVDGVKLWREWNTFADETLLLCADCAVKHEKIEGRTVGDDGRIPDKHAGHLGQKTDQIGLLIPAVPYGDSDTFWGYSSVPDEGVAWWKALPTRREKAEAPHA